MQSSKAHEPLFLLLFGPGLQQWFTIFSCVSRQLRIHPKEQQARASIRAPRTGGSWVEEAPHARRLDPSPGLAMGVQQSSSPQPSNSSLGYVMDDGLIASLRHDTTLHVANRCFSPPSRRPAPPSLSVPLPKTSSGRDLGEHLSKAQASDADPKRRDHLQKLTATISAGTGWKTPLLFVPTQLISNSKSLSLFSA